MGRLFLNGVGLHRGGGLTLLRELARAAAGKLAGAALDARLDAADRARFAGVSATFVPPRLTSRIAASIALASTAGSGDTLFSFASLPPVRRTRARSIVYVHAPYLGGLSAGIRYTRGVAARIALERLWFAAARSNADVFWVQTATMASGLQAHLPAATIRILPFVAADIRRALGGAPSPAAPVPAARYFYPADAVAHKNHAVLLRAWAVLAAEGFRPELALTLSEVEAVRVFAAAGIAPAALPHVLNLGRLPQVEVIARFTAGAALIFPSLTETFGLPMLEAAAAGAALLVSECDFARDVCVADQSFDPMSPRSIADAVRRHLGQPRWPAMPLTAADIVRELLA